MRGWDSIPDNETDHDRHLLRRAYDGCPVGVGTDQIRLLVARLHRIETIAAEIDQMAPSDMNGWILEEARRPMDESKP